MALARILNSSAIFFLLLLLLCGSPLCSVGASHNITAILAANPDLSEFSAALNSYNLTAEIDRRTTITVLAVDNAVMAQHLPADSVIHALEMHVLLDYFDDAKLHSLAAGFTLSTSLLQASGKAKESSGVVNITARGSGRVAFTPYGTPEGSPAVFYEKSIQESPYDIAVLQVSGVIPFPTKEVQAPAPVTSPAPAPATTPSSASPAPTPVPVPSPAPSPATKPSASPAAPTPAPVNSPAPSPPATKPSASPSPTPAADTDNNPPNNGVSNGIASWSLLSVTAVVQAIALVL